MTIRRSVLGLFAVAAIAAGGCGGDIAQQVLSNEQLRGQVLDVIANHRAVALQAVDRIVAVDSLRSSVIDHLLNDDNVAKHVLARVATNPQAFDIVMEAALRDSTMHNHVMVLIKGVQMANAK